MKKLLLAAAAAATFLGGISGAQAACSGGFAVMHDFPGSSFNMSLATNAADGNCVSNVAIVGSPAWTGPLAASGSGLATASSIAGGQFLSTQPTMTNAQQAAMLLSARGELLVSPGVSGFPVTASQAGAWNVTNISGTITLPTNAATSIKQSDGSQKTQIVDGSGNVIAATSNALNVAVTAGNITGFALDTTVQTTNTDLGAPGSTSCATDTGSCNLNALLQRNNQRLSTINTNLGSPLQAGGSIGNTAFGINGTLPAFAAIPAFKTDLTTPGTTNKVSIGTDGTVNPQTPASWSLGAFGSPIPANGTAIGLYDGTNLVRAKGDETNGIWVNIKAGAGSGGTAIADEAAFTQGSTQGTPAFGLFSTSVTNLTNGQTGALRSTNDRQLLVSDASVVAALTTLNTTAGNPLAAQGGAVWIGNVGQNGSWTVGQSGTWNITNISGTISLPTGAATAALQPTNSAIGATTSGQTGNLMMGAVTTAAPTYTTAQTNPLSLTPAGALRVDASASTQPVSGTVTANAGTNLNTSALALEGGGNLATIAGAISAAKMQANVAQFGGTNVSTGTGVGGAGIPRMTVSNDSKVQPWDGTNTVTVKAASTPAASTDTAMVVDQRPGTTLPVKQTYAAAQISHLHFDIASAGDNIVVTRAVGTIKVYGLDYSCATNQTTVTYKDGASNTVGGPYYNVGSHAVPLNAEPRFTTTGTDNFIINLAGATHCGGTIDYLDN